MQFVICGVVWRQKIYNSIYIGTLDLVQVVVVDGVDGMDGVDEVWHKTEGTVDQRREFGLFKRSCT